MPVKSVSFQNAIFIEHLALVSRIRPPCRFFFSPTAAQSAQELARRAKHRVDDKKSGEKESSRIKEQLWRENETRVLVTNEQGEQKERERERKRRRRRGESFMRGRMRTVNDLVSCAEKGARGGRAGGGGGGGGGNRRAALSSTSTSCNRSRAVHKELAARRRKNGWRRELSRVARRRYAISPRLGGANVIPFVFPRSVRSTAVPAPVYPGL